MRRAAKVDANQTMIVQALRKAGVMVLHLHQLGKGVPDILACFGGRNVLLEIKVPGEKPNKEQRDFHAEWGGEFHVVYTPEQAIAVMRREITLPKEKRSRRDPVYGTPWR